MDVKNVRIKFLRKRATRKQFRAIKILFTLLEHTLILIITNAWIEDGFQKEMEFGNGLDLAGQVRGSNENRFYVAATTETEVSREIVISVPPGIEKARTSIGVQSVQFCAEVGQRGDRISLTDEVFGMLCGAAHSFNLLAPLAASLTCANFIIFLSDAFVVFVQYALTHLVPLHNNITILTTFVTTATVGLAWVVYLIRLRHHPKKPQHLLRGLSMIGIFLAFGLLPIVYRAITAKLIYAADSGDDFAVESARGLFRVTHGLAGIFGALAAYCAVRIFRLGLLVWAILCNYVVFSFSNFSLNMLILALVLQQSYKIHIEIATVCFAVIPFITGAAMRSGGLHAIIAELRSQEPQSAEQNVTRESVKNEINHEDKGNDEGTRESVKNEIDHEDKGNDEGNRHYVNKRHDKTRVPTVYPGHPEKHYNSYCLNTEL